MPDIMYFWINKPFAMKRPLSLLLLLLLMIACGEKTTPPMETLYIGTYTDGTSEGIYSLQFDPETGSLDSLELKAILPNPSFLAISEDRSMLYAVQETADFDSLGGGVTAFSLKEGVLKELNSMGSGGAHPCHVALATDGQLAVSNYTGGNLSIFDLDEDGRLGKRQLLDHKVLDTTKTAHVHKAEFNEDGLLVSDLGLDRLQRYSFNEGEWQAAKQTSIALPDGAGPRHFTFNTDRSILYVINELNATITVFKKNDKQEYHSVQTIATLAEGFDGPKACADIHLSPDGRFLYGTNRGENTLVIYSVARDSGLLELIGRTSVEGDWPRNFCMDPSGKFLLVANQFSDAITVFQRNQEDGGLTFLHEFVLSKPVCLVFAD